MQDLKDWILARQRPETVSALVHIVGKMGRGQSENCHGWILGMDKKKALETVKSGVLLVAFG
jgi:hypothetical protein